MPPPPQHLLISAKAPLLLLLANGEKEREEKITITQLVKVWREWFHIQDTHTQNIGQCEVCLQEILCFGQLCTVTGSVIFFHHVVFGPSVCVVDLGQGWLPPFLVWTEAVWRADFKRDCQGPIQCRQIHQWLWNVSLAGTHQPTRQQESDQREWQPYTPNLE